MLLEKYLDVFDDFVGQSSAGVKHAVDDAGQFQKRVEPPGNQLNCSQQLAQAVKRQEMRLQWQEDFVCRRQRVKRQDSQRRWAVENDIVKLIGDFGHAVSQDDLTSNGSGKLHLGSGQINM